MTLIKTLIITFTVLLASNCSSSKKTMVTDPTSENKTVANSSKDASMMEEGYLKGTIVASTTEGDCPYVIEVEGKEAYFLDPTNIESTYQKDGMKIWFTYRGLRMMNRCQKANPIELVDIEKRE